MDHNVRPMADQILKEIRRTNKGEAIKSAPVHALSDILNQKNITQLRSIGKVVQVKNYNKLDKETLIHHLLTVITNFDKIRGILLVSSAQEWALFQRAAATDTLQEDLVDPYDYLPFQLAGMLQSFWLEDRLWFVVPDEIKAVYHRLVDGGFAQVKAHCDLVEQHAVAAVNLYGAILIKDFAQLFNQWNERQITNDDASMILTSRIAREPGYLVWRDCLLSDEFEGEFESDLYESVEEFLEERDGRPRYVPDQQEFLRYADVEYYEHTPQTEALQHYLFQRLDDTKEAELLTGEIHDMCMVQESFQDIFDYLDQSGITLHSTADMERLAKLIMDVWNNTRLWTNHGNTPQEMMTLEQKSKPEHQSQIEMTL